MKDTNAFQLIGNGERRAELSKDEGQLRLEASGETPACFLYLL